MLNLDTRLTIDEELTNAPNLTGRFDRDELNTIGAFCSDGLRRDEASRANWLRRTEAALDLAMQLQKTKTFPWQNCSNILFPLVTIAALQFHSRAYPALVNPTDLVKVQVYGTDPQGLLADRARRVSTHMTWQCLEQDKAWEEQHDRLLINLPVVGCAFKKSYYDPQLGHVVSELVLAKDLILDYWSKSIEKSPRKTHLIPLFRNEVRARVLRGTFYDVLEEKWFQEPPQPNTSSSTIRANNRTGMQPPMTTDDTTPFMVAEQCCHLDLDQDGYAEPYVVTFEQTTGTVLRIVANWNTVADIERVRYRGAERIVDVQEAQYYTKYGFLPSPDGGIYDIGFGVLLGPLNEGVNSLINQMIDSGTLRNLGGGFLGRGAKIRGGNLTFGPGQWQRVDSTGDDLRKSIVPLDTAEPSAVLFNLLTLLIDYTNRVSGSTDLMVGETPGQNTPAETTRSALQEGMKIYSAIFKRCWRGMKHEFQLRYKLNGIYMPVSGGTFGESGDQISKEDYLGDPDRVRPAADPSVTSKQMQIQLLSAVKQAAAVTPGYDKEAVERAWLKAMEVPDADQLYKGVDPNAPPPKDPKVRVAELNLQAKMADMQSKQAQFAAELMEQQRLNNAKIAQLEATAMKAVADIQGDEQDRQINAINTTIGLLKHHNDQLSLKITALIKQMEIENERDLAERAAGSVENASGDAAGA